MTQILVYEILFLKDLCKCLIKPYKLPKFLVFVDTLFSVQIHLCNYSQKRTLLLAGKKANVTLFIVLTV